MNSKILLATSLLIIALPIYAAYAIEGIVAVDVDGTSVDISYNAVGVDIIGIEADMEEIELILEIQVTGDPATLELTFERSFFDAKFGEDDDIFIALSDGEWLDVEEMETTSTSRTIQMELTTGSEEIEIFGTILSGQTLDGPEVIEEPEVMEEPEPEIIEEPEPEVMEEPEVIDEGPKTQCGPGTILKDDECVLDKTCGPGTHLENNECVLDTTPSGSIDADRPPFSQLIFGAAAALVISFAVIIILWIISRGNRQQINP